MANPISLIKVSMRRLNQNEPRVKRHLLKRQKVSCSRTLLVILMVSGVRGRKYTRKYAQCPVASMSNEKSARGPIQVAN